MTMTDYGLMTVSAAVILTVAAYWWRRAPETARIVATELGWSMGSFWAALYVWSQLAIDRPLCVVAIGMFALGAIWIGVLLPIVIRRSTTREEAAAQRREDESGHCRKDARVGAAHPDGPASGGGPSSMGSERRRHRRSTAACRQLHGRGGCGRRPATLPAGRAPRAATGHPDGETSP